MSTKEALADYGRKLLLMRGVNGFSFQDLSDAFKIRKASVHHHFPTKSELLLYVIQLIRLKFAGWVGERLPSASPKENLKAYLQIFDNFCHQGNANCPVGALSADFESLPEDVQNEAREFLKSHVKFVEGQVSGLKKIANLSEKDLSLLIVSAALGAVQVGRVLGDKKVAAKSGAALLKVIAKD